MTNSKYIGIDLGTSNTLIYTKENGIVVREPSVVAYDKASSRVLAVGSAAKRMVGKTPSSVEAMHPLRSGVISDYEFCTDMLNELIRRALGNYIGLRPKAIVCAPFGITEVERRAVEDTCIEAGAGSVMLVEEPLLAAIGAGLPVAGTGGNMVVNLGGGTTEIAVVSHGGIVASSSLKIAGNTLDNAIVSYIKQQFNVLIGESSAEEIKIQIGSAHPGSDIGAIEVKGRNMRDGRAAEFTLYSTEVREAISESLVSIFDGIRSVLDATPPELCADIYDSGITLCGGGAMLGGLNFYLHDKTRLPVKIATRPLDCVIDGIGKLICDQKLRNLVEEMKVREEF